MDFLEVPGARHDFLIRFASRWPRLQENQRFHVDLALGQQDALLLQGMRADPDAFLQPPKSTRAEKISELIALGALGGWQVEQNQAPASVPLPEPTGFRIASPQSVEATCLGEPQYPVERFAIWGRSNG